jgi:hypothetical protein
MWCLDGDGRAVRHLSHRIIPKYLVGGTHVGLSLPSVLSPPDIEPEIFTAITLVERPDETFDMCLGFLEHHATNGPNVDVKLLVSAKEVICKNSSRGSVPGITGGTPELELELICCAALSVLRIPVVYIVLVDDFFKPVLLRDQSLHMLPNSALWG